MKHLLSILCLFVLSCDSGGDDAITMDDLNGDWWGRSICKTYVGSGCIEDEVEEDTCPPSESYDDEYTKIVDGSFIDCDSDDEPECEPDNWAILTIINGNTFQLCEIEDADCDIGTMELNGDFLELTYIENEIDDCERTTVWILERKD